VAVPAEYFTATRLFCAYKRRDAGPPVPVMISVMPAGLLSHWRPVVPTLVLMVMTIQDQRHVILRHQFPEIHQRGRAAFLADAQVGMMIIDCHAGERVRSQVLLQPFILGRSGSVRHVFAIGIQADEMPAAGVEL